MMVLNGIKILDFTRLLPGPFATNMLALMGAEVIKIEKHEAADYVSKQPPFIEGISTLYAALNSNKKIIRLNWEEADAKKELLSMIETTDIVIEQFRPGLMKHWGLDYESLKKINPKLIYLSLSGYGQEGPLSSYAGHDLNYLAESGVLDQIRDSDGNPVIPGVQIADIAGGSYMLQIACLSALLNRERTNDAQYIDVSMTDAVFPLLAFPLTQLWGGFDQREMKILNGGLVNYNVYKCSDGKWVALGALETKFWNSFCEALKKNEWKREHMIELSINNFDKNLLDNLFIKKTRDEWILWAREIDVCLSPVVELHELDENPNFIDNTSSAYVENKNKIGLKYFNLPFK